MTQVGQLAVATTAGALATSAQAAPWVGVFTHAGIVHVPEARAELAAGAAPAGAPWARDTEPRLPLQVTDGSTVGTPGLSTKPDITRSTGFPVTLVSVPQKSSARAFEYLNRSM